MAILNCPLLVWADIHAASLVRHADVRDGKLVQHSRPHRRALGKLFERGQELWHFQPSLERLGALPDGVVDHDVGSTDAAMQLGGDVARLLLEDLGSALPDGESLFELAGRDMEVVDQDDRAGVLGVELLLEGGVRVEVESGDAHIEFEGG